MSNNLNTGSNSNLNNGSVGQAAVQYLLIALAGRKYGVRLDTLQEVVRYDQLTVAPVPNSPEWLDGITSLRGNILSAVSLRAFLGLKRETSNPSSQAMGEQAGGFSRSAPRLLVAFTPELTVGLVVDDIEGVIFVQPEQIKIADASAARYAIQRTDPASAYLEGFYADPENKREVALLNLRRLITSPLMLQFEPAHA